MLYFIDSANKEQIEDALSTGACGITANPSMYRKEQTSISSFMDAYTNKQLSFFSIEVIGTYDAMLTQATDILKKDRNIVIKLNFSKDSLRLTRELHAQGYRTALTLVFTMAQAVAAINAGCDYIFFFIGRNEETGKDALTVISAIQQMISEKYYKTKLVAASIKNLYQLEMLAELRIDYAAIPYDLYIKSLYHPLSESGAAAFLEDFTQLTI